MLDTYHEVEAAAMKAVAPPALSKRCPAQLLVADLSLDGRRLSFLHASSDSEAGYSQDVAVLVLSMRFQWCLSRTRGLSSRRGGDCAPSSRLRAVMRRCLFRTRG